MSERWTTANVVEWAQSIYKLGRPARETDFYSPDLPASDYCTAYEGVSWLAHGRCQKWEQRETEDFFRHSLWKRSLWENGQPNDLLAALEGVDITDEDRLAHEAVYLDIGIRWEDGPFRGLNGEQRLNDMVSEASAFWGLESNRADLIARLKDEADDKRRIERAEKDILYAIKNGYIDAVGEDISADDAITRTVRLNLHSENELVFCGEDIGLAQETETKLLWKNVRVSVSGVRHWKEGRNAKPQTLEDLRNLGSMTSCQALTLLAFGTPQTSEEIAADSFRPLYKWGFPARIQHALDKLDPAVNKSAAAQNLLEMMKARGETLTIEQARDIIRSEWEDHQSWGPKFRDAGARILRAAREKSVGIWEWDAELQEDRPLDLSRWNRPISLDKSDRLTLASGRELAQGVTFKTTEIEALIEKPFAEFGEAFQSDHCKDVSDMLAVEVVLSTSFADTRPSPSIPAMRRWYRDRIDEWPATQPPPNEAADIKAALSYFSDGFDRDVFRKIRRELAPASWQAKGPRKPWRLCDDYGEL